MELVVTAVLFALGLKEAVAVGAVVLVVEVGWLAVANNKRVVRDDARTLYCEVYSRTMIFRLVLGSLWCTNTVVAVDMGCVGMDANRVASTVARPLTSSVFV
jgi:hypothetical protein